MLGDRGCQDAPGAARPPQGSRQSPRRDERPRDSLDPQRKLELLRRSPQQGRIAAPTWLAGHAAKPSSGEMPEASSAAATASQAGRDIATTLQRQAAAKTVARASKPASRPCLRPPARSAPTEPSRGRRSITKHRFPARAEDNIADLNVGIRPHAEDRYSAALEQVAHQSKKLGSLAK